MAWASFPPPPPIALLATRSAGGATRPVSVVPRGRVTPRREKLTHQLLRPFGDQDAGRRAVSPPRWSGGVLTFVTPSAGLAGGYHKSSFSLSHFRRDPTSADLVPSPPRGRLVWIWTNQQRKRLCVNPGPGSLACGVWIQIRMTMRPLHQLLFGDRRSVA